MHDGDRASRSHRDRHALRPLPGKPLFARQEALHGGPITPGVEADHFDHSKIGLEHCHFEFLQCVTQIHRRNSAILQLEIPLSTPLSTQFLPIHLTRIAPPGSPSLCQGEGEHIQHDSALRHVPLRIVNPRTLFPLPVSKQSGCLPQGRSEQARAGLYRGLVQSQRR